MSRIENVKIKPQNIIIKDNQARKAKEIQGEKVSFWLNIGFLAFIFVIAILTIFIK